MECLGPSLIVRVIDGPGGPALDAPDHEADVPQGRGGDDRLVAVVASSRRANVSSWGRSARSSDDLAGVILLNLHAQFRPLDCYSDKIERDQV